MHPVAVLVLDVDRRPIPTSPLADDAGSTTTAGPGDRERLDLGLQQLVGSPRGTRSSRTVAEPLAVAIALDPPCGAGPSSSASSDSSRFFWPAVIGSGCHETCRGGYRRYCASRACLASIPRAAAT